MSMTISNSPAYFRALIQKRRVMFHDRPSSLPVTRRYLEGYAPYSAFLLLSRPSLYLICTRLRALPSRFTIFRACIWTVAQGLTIPIGSSHPTNLYWILLLYHKIRSLKLPLTNIRHNVYPANLSQDLAP